MILFLDMSYSQSFLANIKTRYNVPDDIIPGPSEVKTEQVNLEIQETETPVEVMNTNQASATAFEDDFDYVEKFRHAFENKLILKAKVFLILIYNYSG